MRRHFNILLDLNYSVAFDRKAFSAIATVANERGNVRLIRRMSGSCWHDDVLPTEIDGIIVTWLSELDESYLGKLNIPFVSLADRARASPNQCVVAMDEAAIGAMAAKYFLDAGYEHFAVFARPSVLTNFGGRIGEFIATLRAAGHDCFLGPKPTGRETAPNEHGETAWDTCAAEWLSGLPKEIAVFAPYDYYGQVAVNAARSAGIRVPDDMAVLGVDDDEMFCMTTSPQLSSIVTPGFRVGQLAITTLLGLLSGEDDVPRRSLVPPVSVVVRGSSSEFAMKDPDVISAMRFIRDNAAAGVTVKEVADHVLLSRRTLERRFVASVSHTVGDEIRRAKIDRAKRLLIDTDLPYSEVSRRSGLMHQQQLNRLIKMSTGQTPAQFRKIARDKHLP